MGNIGISIMVLILKELQRLVMLFVQVYLTTMVLNALKTVIVHIKVNPVRVSVAIIMGGNVLDLLI